MHSDTTYFRRVCTGILATLMIAGCSRTPDWLSDTEERLPGERVAIMESADNNAAADLATNGKAGALKLPPATTTDQWPLPPRLLRRTLGHLLLDPHLKPAGSTEAGSGEAWPLPYAPTPVINDGRVFVMDAAGVISAHAADNLGRTLWTSRLLAEEEASTLPGGGLAFTGNRLFAASATGVLAALDAETGATHWLREFPAPIRAAPVTDNDQLYVLTADNALYVLETDTGVLRWKHSHVTETTSLFGAASPAIAKGMVIAPFSSGEVIAFKARTGREVWVQSLVSTRGMGTGATLNDIDATPLIAGNLVAVSGRSGVLTFLDMRTGQRLWEQPIALAQPPWIAGEYLYALDTDARLYCLWIRDGSLIWRKQLPVYGDPEDREDLRRWYGPVVAGDSVWVAGGHGVLLQVSPADGSDIRRMTVPDNIVQHPVIAGKRLYLLTRDAQLYAYE